VKFSTALLMESCLSPRSLAMPAGVQRQPDLSFGEKVSINAIRHLRKSLQTSFTAHATLTSRATIRVTLYNTVFECAKSRRCLTKKICNFATV